ncbi:MAG: DUF1835 domain-containing protein [Bacteroidota bacterium]
MAGKVLHILNGDSLSEGLQLLDLGGDTLVWREMLCAGPVTVEVGGDRFFESRSSFLNQFFEVSESRYHDGFIKPLTEITNLDQYEEINLWFEYDLFCHINLLGSLAWISQHSFSGKVFHICSGRVKGVSKLLGLSELTEDQLRDHFRHKKLLNSEDLEIANDIWLCYTNDDPSAILPKIPRRSSFDYLSNCLKSHIERFPSIETGLNALETHVLQLIETHSIKSEHQLCGYALSQQGYYGYGDSQIMRVIRNLRPYFSTVEGHLKLNGIGIKLLNKEINVLNQLQSEYSFGGAKKYDWLYDAANNKLIKR